MTIDFANGLYFHPESHGFLFGMANREEPSTTNKTVDEGWLATNVEALVARAPAFADANVLRGWAGFYEVTPDDNPRPRLDRRARRTRRRRRLQWPRLHAGPGYRSSAWPS